MSGPLPDVRFCWSPPPRRCRVVLTRIRPPKAERPAPMAPGVGPPEPDGPRVPRSSRGTHGWVLPEGGPTQSMPPRRWPGRVRPTNRRTRSDLGDLVEGQLDRGLSTEDRHQDLELLGVGIDLAHRRGQGRERALHDGDGLADFVGHVGTDLTTGGDTRLLFLLRFRLRFWGQQ